MYQGTISTIVIQLSKIKGPTDMNRLAKGFFEEVVQDPCLRLMVLNLNIPHFDGLYVVLPKVL